MQPTERDLAAFREWVDRAAWVTAKRGAPHQYVVRGKQVIDDELWLRLVKMIRRYGEPGKFHRNVLIYWIVDDHRYWTMGPAWGVDAVTQAIIINRARKDDVYGVQDAPHTASELVSVYDWLAPDYDARYATPECQAENEQVADLLRDLAPDPVRALDIGAGTGLLLDLNCLKLDGYTAVDPCQAMLNELIRKHPRVTDVHPTRLEDADLNGARFDLVTALFGAASYCTPGAVLGLLSRLTPGGRMLLMFYEPGYLPDYYTGEPPVYDSSLGVALGAFHRAERIGRFVVVVR
jgi:hypothetical protein